MKRINIGAAINGGLGQRRPYDFYSTPWEATEALLEEVQFPDWIWECAAGDGAMVEVMAIHGYQVVATEIRWEKDAQDFLQMRPPVADMDEPYAIVTNPPFSLAAQFIKNALRFTPFCAFLLKATFFHAAKRLLLPLPSRVLPLTWRVDFSGAGCPTMDLCWYVWGIEGTPFKPLAKPTKQIFMGDILNAKTSEATPRI